MKIIEPPVLIHSAPVLLYAETGGTDAFTGTMTLIVDSKILGSVPRLAICEELLTGESLLMHCDENWNSLGVSVGPTCEYVKASADRAYSGLAQKWQKFRQLSKAELLNIEEVTTYLRKLGNEYPIENS